MSKGTKDGHFPITNDEQSVATTARGFWKHSVSSFEGFLGGREGERKFLVERYLGEYVWNFSTMVARVANQDKVTSTC